MTVPATNTISISYLEDGVTLTPFAYPYPIVATTDLIVTRVIGGAAPVAVIGWSAVAADVGAIVTLPNSVAGATLTISRMTAIQQLTQYLALGDFPAESTEEALDRLTLIAQELLAALVDLGRRALQVPIGETTTILPALEQRKGTILGFDATTGLPILIVLSGTPLNLDGVLAGQIPYDVESFPTDTDDGFVMPTKGLPFLSGGDNIFKISKGP